MAGLYFHITRSTGTILTPAIYNGDHRNHIDYETPVGYDDHSADLATMRLHTDPYPASVESLATSLAGELERIRFVLRQLKVDSSISLRHWYHPDHAQGDPLFDAVFSD